MTKTTNPNQDLVGKRAWESVWSGRRGDRYRPLDRSPTYMAWRMKNLLDRAVPSGARVFEAGCGGSFILPYLARGRGRQVWGIDYSEKGVELTRSYLEAERVEGKVIHGDFFKDNDLRADYFDLVISMGFIEHFPDPGPVVARLASHARPGGKIITSVPNLEGAVGRMHRAADPELFNEHVVIGPKTLDQLHQDNGLEIIAPARYFGVFCITVVSWRRVMAMMPGPLGQAFWISAKAAQEVVCAPFRLLGRGPETRAFAPFIIGIYEKPKNR